MSLIPNNEKYLRLQTASSAVMGHLGLSSLRWIQREELTPYVIYILEYINAELILSGKTTVIQKVQAFIDLYGRGTDKIVDNNILTLLSQLKIPSTDPEYREDLFCLTWGNLGTSIYMALLYNYPELFSKEKTDCHSCGCSGGGKEKLPEWIGPIISSGNMGGGCGCTG